MTGLFINVKTTNNHLEYGLEKDFYFPMAKNDIEHKNISIMSEKEKVGV